MADPRELSPAELVARGLIPAGPLAPAMTSKNPATNMQAIRDLVNPKRIIPDPTQYDPLALLSKMHHEAGVGLGHLAGALGGLNLGGAMMSPEQKALRSRQLGNQFRDFGETALMPMASAGKIIGPVAQEARPLFNAFLTRLGQMGAMGGLQKGMEGKGIGEIFGAATITAALQGAMEGVASPFRTLLSSRAGQKILADGAAKFKEALGSFQTRQQFDQEFVSQLNELRLQGHKEAAAQLSREYGQRAFNYKVEGQQMVAKWERQVTAQQMLQEAAEQAHMHQAAERIATVWDERVPAWQGLGQNVKGLVDRVYGKGKDLLQNSFDTSLKEIITKAEGKAITIPAADANTLGIGVAKGPLEGSPAGVITNTMTGAPDMARVDAAELASAVYGHKADIDPDVYNSVAKRLIDAGLGNQKANAEYSSGMALREFMDRTQALEYIGEPKLDVEKLLKGLTKQTTLKTLQNRIPGEDAIEGTIAAAREGLPQALPDIPKPVQGPLAPKPVLGPPPVPIKTDPNLAPSKAPTEPTPEELGVTVGEGPSAQKLATAGGLLGAGLGGQFGGGYGHYGVGGVGGTMLGLLLSKLLSGPTVRGPISPLAESILSKAPSVATGALRGIFRAPLTPEEIAKMDAEIHAGEAAGTTALQNPNLSLEVDPVENR